MLDLSRLKYRVTCIADDGQFDLTDITTGLGFSEGAKELACKIQLKVAVCEVNGKSTFELLKPFTQIILWADIGEGYDEVTRGKIQKITVTETNHDYFLDIEAADEAGELRKSQNSFFFTDGHSSSAILREILSKHGINAEIHITDIKHAKKVYRGKYLSDMIDDVLKDIREQGKGEYFIRASKGKIEIVKRGDNSVVWHFDAGDNLTKVTESFDASKTVTKVKVVGKSKAEGHPSIEATVNGKTEYGTRQVIYERPHNESAGDAEKSARKILDEQGEPKRKVTIETVDVPTLRKNDKIRVKSSLGTSYFTVKSIRHNCVNHTMNLELDYFKDADKTLLGQVFSLAEGTESASTDPP